MESTKILHHGDPEMPKSRDAEMNARLREVNPMVQMKLKKIGGLL
jgi:hypothetical protein